MQVHGPHPRSIAYLERDLTVCAKFSRDNNRILLLASKCDDVPAATTVIRLRDFAFHRPTAKNTDHSGISPYCYRSHSHCCSYSLCVCSFAPKFRRNSENFRVPENIENILPILLYTIYTRIYSIGLYMILETYFVKI